MRTGWRDDGWKGEAGVGDRNTWKGVGVEGGESRGSKEAIRSPD